MGERNAGAYSAGGACTAYGYAVVEARPGRGGTEAETE